MSAFTPLPNLLARRAIASSRPEPGDAIVVLAGAGILPGPTLTDSSLRRAVHGIVLHRRGLAPLLVFSGVGSGEARVRATLARELGVPPERIVTDAGARTTREEAVRLRALLGPRGVRRILLVTDSPHIVRARELFAREGFEVLAAPVQGLPGHGDTPEARLELMSALLRELLARVYNRATGGL